MRVNTVDVFCMIFEIRRMKLVQIVLRRGKRGGGRTMGGENLTKIYLSTCANIAMYRPM
jgi:hypothetical protein